MISFPDMGKEGFPSLPGNPEPQFPMVILDQIGELSHHLIFCLEDLLGIEQHGLPGWGQPQHRFAFK